MMMPTRIEEQAPVAPPSFQRGQARLSRALHIDALTLVTMLHLLTLCRLAVRLAHRRCPPPLPAGKGGRQRSYSEESLLLISLCMDEEHRHPEKVRTSALCIFFMY